jgi:hypothetical protein
MGQRDGQVDNRPAPAIEAFQDLDFVTRLERSGQTADAAEPFSGLRSKCLHLVSRLVRRGPE